MRLLLVCLNRLHEAGAGTFYTKIARHDVKLYSQCGCDPRKQSAGGKDTPMKREEVKNKIPGITDEQLDWLMGENGRNLPAPIRFWR